MADMDNMAVTANVFGNVRKVILGSNGCDCCPLTPKPKITIYDKSMEILNPMGCWCIGVTIYDRKMIMRHRVMSVSKRKVVYYPCCCFPVESFNFKLTQTKRMWDFTEPNEIDFKLSTCGGPQINQQELNSIYEFV